MERIGGVGFRLQFCESNRRLFNWLVSRQFRHLVSWRFREQAGEGVGVGSGGFFYAASGALPRRHVEQKNGQWVGDSHEHSACKQRNDKDHETAGLKIVPPLFAIRAGYRFGCRHNILSRINQ